MNHGAEYFEYLQGRSWTGLLYRNYWLYPKLKTVVSGDTLDIGCGIGDFVKFHAGCVGTDINPETVKWCQKQGLNVLQMEPDRLPFEVNSFDTVVMDNILEHVADPQHILTEVYRVLRKDGVFVVGVPGEKGFASDPDHKIFYTRDSLEITLKSNGFRLTKMFGMPFNFQGLSKRMRQYCEYGVFRKELV